MSIALSGGGIAGGGSGAPNRVAFWSDSHTLTSSANLTFDGSNLVASGTLTGSNFNTSVVSNGSVVTIAGNGLATSALYFVGANSPGSVAFYAQQGTYDGGTTMFCRGEGADGASAVGVVSDTLVAYSNATAKIHSFRNATVEKAFIDKNGALTLSGIGSNAAITGSYSASQLFLDGAFGAGLKCGTHSFVQVALGEVVQYAPAAAPADADITTSSISFYLDESGNNLKVKVRYSNGTTIKTGTVALI